MKRMLFLLMVILIGVLVFMGCDKEETYYPEGYAILQNQIEHSGIAIEIIELDTFIITGETGHYDLGFFKEGEYSLNFVFPYYKNGKHKIKITHGRLDTPIPDIELQQLLHYTNHVYDNIFRLGHYNYFKSEVTNMSGIPVSIEWCSDRRWTTVCYEELGLVAFSYSAITEVIDTLFPGDTVSIFSFLIGGLTRLNWVVDTPYNGIVAVTGGILTTNIFSELNSTWAVYFPERTIGDSATTMSEYVYKKLPWEIIRIE